MKIVLITHHFPPKYYGGTEQYTYRAAQALQKAGHTVEVVCLESITEGGLVPTCVRHNYQGLVVNRLSFDINQAPDPFEWSFRNPQLGQWFQDYLKRTSPDLVHINSGYLLGGTVPEAAFALGIPTVLTLHDYWFICPLIILLRTDGTLCDGHVPPTRCTWCFMSQKRRYRWAGKKIERVLGDAFVRLSRLDGVKKNVRMIPRPALITERRSYLKQILEQIDIVLAPSRFLISQVENYGFHLRRLLHLPFGLDVSQIASFGPKTPAKQLRLGYLGQFSPHKGVHLLLDAFQRLRKTPGSCVLTLYGNMQGASAYERKLMRKIQSTPDVEFAGPYANPEVGHVLKELDAIVVPSIWYENRPTVIVEAHASQTPVVTADLGGMAELIQHDQNGLLFASGNVQSLTIQLQRLIDDPQLLPRLRAGVEPVPSVEDEIAKLISVYASLL